MPGRGHRQDEGYVDKGPRELNSLDRVDDVDLRNAGEDVDYYEGGGDDATGA